MPLAQELLGHIHVKTTMIYTIRVAGSTGEGMTVENSGRAMHG